MEEVGLAHPTDERIFSETLKVPVLVRNGLVCVVAGRRGRLSQAPAKLTIIAIDSTLILDVGTTSSLVLGDLLLRTDDKSFAPISGIPKKVSNYTLQFDTDKSEGTFTAYRRPDQNGSEPALVGPTIGFEIGKADLDGPLTAWNQHERLARDLAAGMFRRAVSATQGGALE